MDMPSKVAELEDLRVEYEKQIKNISKLLTLYEERAAATLLENRRELEREEAIIAVLENKSSYMQEEIEDCEETKEELGEKIEILESTLQESEDELVNTKNLFSSCAQNSTLNSQTNLTNDLFSQMLVSPEVDLDRMTRILKEHHGFIKDLTIKGDSNNVAALLLVLAEQMDKEQEPNGNEELRDEKSSLIKKQLQSEMSCNLSRVLWVIGKLLIHYQTPFHKEPAGGADNCYKSIQTPSGPRSVISVSQTFLTLKDLILEKKRLVNEVGRLKTLNDHLENHLGNQEKRLSVVTTELRKTWSVVNKIKAQHKQLHTQEKILRYELQQKRCMLTELKEELENCRDKWEKARQKNSQTEEDWKKLRKEFATRKSHKESNSAESGYEEDDVQSPPSESHQYVSNLFERSKNGVNKPEPPEKDIENAHGNSFDTVIELLDIDFIESQQIHQSEVPSVLCGVTPNILEMPPNLLPVTGSEFAAGLEQIDAEDLAAVLDVKYQTQLLGVDYNLSLPSSSGSSPIRTDNDDFTPFEADVSEEDMLSNDNHNNSSSLTYANQTVSEDVFLFGSKASKNISRFLDGLFVKSEEIVDTKTLTSSKLCLSIHNTSKTEDKCASTSAAINNNSHFQSSANLTPNVIENYCYIFPDSNNTIVKKKNVGNEQSPLHCPPYRLNKTEETHNGQCFDKASETSFDLVEKTEDYREDRLKRLEHQCRSLMSKVASTSFRSEIISNKLDELHLAYGPVDNDINEDCFPKEKINSKSMANTQCQIKLQSEASTSKNAIPLEDTYFYEEMINSSSSNFVNKIELHLPNPGKSDTDVLKTRTADMNILEDKCKWLHSTTTSSRSESLPKRRSVPCNCYLASEKTLAESVQSSHSKISTLDNETKEQKVIFQKEFNKSVLTNQEESIQLKPLDSPVELGNLNKCSPVLSLELVKGTANEKKIKSPEEILEARAERFKRLEDQCKSLLSKMAATSLRSETISNKLDKLHSCYGSSEHASNNKEYSLLSKNGDKRFVSVSYSSSNNKQLMPLYENSVLTKSNTLSNITTVNSVNSEVLQGFSQINLLTGNLTDVKHDGNTALLRKISKEIQAKEDKRSNTSQNERDPNINNTSIISDVAVISKQHQGPYK